MSGVKDIATDTKEPVLLDIEMTPLGADGSRIEDEVSRIRREEKLVAQRRFIGLFLVPLILIGVYIFLIASDVFLSETKFLVRAPTPSSPLGNTLQIARSSDEPFIIEAFLRSRDVVDQLEKSVALKSRYMRKDTDWLSRYPNWAVFDTFENLHNYFLNWTKTEIDETTGIITLRVFAFSAQDAKTIAEGMLERAEALVNRLNTRAYVDRLNYAKTVVDKSGADIEVVEKKMTEFRRSTGTVDMGREASAALEQISKLTIQIATLEAALKQQIALTPNSPSIISTRQQIASFQNEINTLRKQIVGGSGSMVTELAQFERLTLERQLAARALESAIANLDRVRQQVQVQQFYLARISEPALPQTPEYPRRALTFAILAAGLFLTYRALIALVASIQEHGA